MNAQPSNRLILGFILAGGFTLLFAFQQEFILSRILYFGLGFDFLYLWFTAIRDQRPLLPALILTLYGLAGSYAMYRLYYTSIWMTYGICATVSLSDVCQYGVGKYWGRSHINSFSPKKTREGYLGGALLTLILAWPLYPPVQTGPWIFLGMLGDYLISILKRWLGVKDISPFLLDHGGWLDRLDGIFMAAIVWAFFYH